MQLHALLGPEKLEDAGRILPRSPQRQRSPAHTSWTSILQSEQRTRSCCFKPPSLGRFVIAALGRLMQWSTISLLISRTDGDTAIFLIHS